ncbi:MAG: hypothetical protein C4306_03320 [Thermoleophilia bacterium]
MRRAVAWALVLAVVTLGLAVWARQRGDAAARVLVEGLEQKLPPGTTFAEAVRRLDLRAPAGDLLDLQGAILRAGVFPGRILLNGRVAPASTQVRDGDRITVVPGPDRREPVERLVVRVRGGRPTEPQFTLARVPGEQVLLRGRISHRLVPLAFRPRGPARVPQAVALTFDDGPSHYTRAVLAVLRRLRARATFFVVGELAARRPALVRAELGAGMAVQSHSYSHPYRPPFDRQPRPRIRAEIERTKALLDRLGARASLFRPPGGAFSPYVLEAAGAAGQRVVLWSVDPQDWRPSASPGEIARRVLRAARPGSIVLLHDGGGNRSATVKALPAIIRGLRRKGLKLALIEPPPRR